MWQPITAHQPQPEDQSSGGMVRSMEPHLSRLVSCARRAHKGERALGTQLKLFVQAISCPSQLVMHAVLLILVFRGGVSLSASREGQDNALHAGKQSGETTVLEHIGAAHPWLVPNLGKGIER